MVSTVQLFICSGDTFPMIEGFMFCKSVQDSAAAPSFPCLMMVVARFRQASGEPLRQVLAVVLFVGDEVVVSEHKIGHAL